MSFIDNNIVFEEIIVKVNENVTRAGEGSAVQLENGDIYFSYSKFSEHVDDDAPADVCSIKYNVTTKQWQNLGIVFNRNNSTNLMSTSMLCMDDNRIVITYIEKETSWHNHIWAAFSSNDGKNWSLPVRITPENHSNYYVVNNDRLIQTISGRLILPVAIYFGISEGIPENSYNGVFYSDDLGNTWGLSDTLQIQKTNVIEPQNLKKEYVEAWQDTRSNSIRNEEPGVVELSDGKIMMWCRTNIGYMYKCFSEDQGKTWSEFLPDTNIISPCGPQSIKRIPDTSRLLCLYNDHAGFDYLAQPWWDWRTPLTAAISDNNGKSWSVIGQFEDSSHNYCYTSILFYNENVLFTYYISENSKEGEVEKRINLASLKVKIVKKEAFL
jgi:sialidase-1